jgi:hypothetical protein
MVRRLLGGVLIGSGSALSVVVFVSWQLLMWCLESGYLIVGEAKVVEAAQVATVVGAVLGVLLVVAGLGLELFGRKRG